jgi:hypothetical protein
MAQLVLMGISSMEPQLNLWEMRGPVNMNDNSVYFHPLEACNLVGDGGSIKTANGMSLSPQFSDADSKNLCVRNGIKDVSFRTKETEKKIHSSCSLNMTENEI